MLPVVGRESEGREQHGRVLLQGVNGLRVLRLREAALAAFEAEGFHVALNTPFPGAIVPARHDATDLRVGSVMIEVNRALYMDEASGAWLPGAGELRACLRRALGVLIATHIERARA